MEIEKEQKTPLKHGKNFKLPVHQEIVSGPTKNNIDPDAMKDDHLFSYEKKQEVKMADVEETEDESEDEDFEDDDDSDEDED